MLQSDDFYRKKMLEHYHHPHNHGVIENPSVVKEIVNRVCGDELTLYLQTEYGLIKDIKMTVKGCSINVSSGSIMSKIVMGLPIEQADKIIKSFCQSMVIGKENVSLPDELKELECLQEVKKYPVRVKCALLPWTALTEALESVNDSKEIVATPCK